MESTFITWLKANATPSARVASYQYSVVFENKNTVDSRFFDKNTGVVLTTSSTSTNLVSVPFSALDTSKLTPGSRFEGIYFNTKVSPASLSNLFHSLPWKPLGVGQPNYCTLASINVYNAAYTAQAYTKLMALDLSAIGGTGYALMMDREDDSVFPVYLSDFNATNAGLMSLSPEYAPAFYKAGWYTDCVTVEDIAVTSDLSGCFFEATGGIEKFYNANIQTFMNTLTAIEPNEFVGRYISEDSVSSTSDVNHIFMSPFTVASADTPSYSGPYLAVAGPSSIYADETIEIIAVKIDLSSGYPVTTIPTNISVSGATLTSFNNGTGKAVITAPTANVVVSEAATE